MKPSITEARTWARSPPPTASRNRVSPGEHHLLVDDERDHVVGVSRRREAADAQVSPLPLTGLGDDVDAVARAELVLVDDVVGVRVRAQDHGRRRAPGLDRGQQRSDVGAGVDEHRRPSLPVGDHEGVREPVRMHAPLDQHHARLTKHRSLCTPTRRTTDGAV